MALRRQTGPFWRLTAAAPRGIFTRFPQAGEGLPAAVSCGLAGCWYSWAYYSIARGGSQERGGACGAPAALRFLLCDAEAGWKAGLFRGCLVLDGAVLPGTGRPLVLTPEADKIGNIHVYTTNSSCIYRTPPLFSYILFVKFNLF